MVIDGKVWQDSKDKLWLAEISLLDLMVQAVHKEEIPETVKDAIELLVEDSEFSVTATLVGDSLAIDSNNPARLDALIMKRQRAKSEDVAH